ncbi:MAG TPA: hypothetical protein VHV83_00755 [Armatimonadota bacterium]|nr:hypothetical protein [Armatimonadota bacterium]
MEQSDQRQVVSVDDLTKAATAFLPTADEDENSVATQKSALEEAIYRAHQLLRADLQTIEQAKHTGGEPDYVAAVGNAPDKLAALIFLAKQKMLDIEHSRQQMRDTQDAQRDLSLYVEILFHVKAVDALTIFYDFAIAQRESRQPQLWQNVCSRSLYLLALLTECRVTVQAFLAQRPEACSRLSSLAASTRADIAFSLKSLLYEYQQQQTMATAATQAVTMAPYAVIYQQEYAACEQEAASGQGTSSLLSAQDRIHQAAKSGDVPSLVSWIREGSPAATRAAFQAAFSVMTTDQYIDMLSQVLVLKSITTVRLSAAVMELGNLNRSARTPGGTARVNQLLVEVAETAQEDRIDVAKIAVRELTNANAISSLGHVVQEAPLVAIAEAALLALKDLRQLPVSPAFLEKRPELLHVYRMVQEELRELRSLVDTACSCPSEEMALFYLAQLKEVNALPELRQLSLLHNKLGEAARDILAQQKR